MNGTKYEGEYEGDDYNGKRQGKGRVSTKEGDTYYIGEWHDDKPEGHGEYYSIRKQVNIYYKG